MAKLDFHIVKRIREQIAKGGNRTALKHKVGKEWQGISWQQFGLQVDNLSLALLAQGLRIQDKIGIFQIICRNGRSLISLLCNYAV